MSELKFEYKSVSRFSSAVSGHAFLLRPKPYGDDSQRVKNFKIEIPQSKSLFWQKDSFGNDIAFSSIDGGHTEFEVRAVGAVEVVEGKKVTAFNPIFRYPSPLCFCDDEMAKFAAFYKADNAAQTVRNICAAVHERIIYTSGTTCVSTDSVRTFSQKSGVCQDIAHVFVALLRSVGIPARYVAGYVKGLTKSHAWTEAYYDGFWHGFDATENISQSKDYIKIAHGRDAADCPLNRGVFCGSVVEAVEIEIKVE